MVVGIVLFAMAMTAYTSTNAFYRFSRRPFVRRTLYIGYGIRIAISIIFPIGMSVDLPSGMMITAVVGELFSPTPNMFLLTLLTTLLQGTALNIILAAVMVPIWGIQRTTMTPKQFTKTSCARCGYDLVATPPGEPCPECGSQAGYADFDTTPLSKENEFVWGFYVLAGLMLLVLAMFFVYGNPH